MRPRAGTPEAERISLWQELVEIARRVHTSVGLPMVVAGDTAGPTEPRRAVEHNLQSAPSATCHLTGSWRKELRPAAAESGRVSNNRGLSQRREKRQPAIPLWAGLVLPRQPRERVVSGARHQSFYVDGEKPAAVQLPTLLLTASTLLVPCFNRPEDDVRDCCVAFTDHLQCVRPTGPMGRLAQPGRTTQTQTSPGKRK